MKTFLKNNQFKIYFFLSFVIAIIPRTYLALQTITIRSISDSISLLSVPAYLAGYDWTNISSQGGYYGYGFYGLFFWIYRVSDNPIVIYKFFAFLGAVLQSTIAPACVWLWIKGFKKSDYNFALLLSIFFSYFNDARAGVTYNEHPLIVLIWLMCILLCKLVECKNEKNRKILTLGIMCILIYGFTLHERMLAIVIAFIISICIYSFVYKEKIISLSILPIGVFGIAGVKKCTSLIQEILWYTNENGNLRNASISISVPEVKSLYQIFNVIFCQIFSFSVFSMGLFLISIFILVCFLLKQIYVNIKRKEKVEQIHSKILNKKIFLIGTMMLVTFGGTVMVQALNWGRGIAYGDPYSYKAYFYLRYAIPFASIIILCGILIYTEAKINISKLVYLYFGVMGGSILYFIKEIIPVVKNNVVCATAGMGALMGYMNDGKINESNYFRMLLIFLTVSLITFLLVRIEKNKLALVIICLAVIYQYHFLDKNQDKAIQTNNYKMVNASFTMINEWKECGLDIPKTFYVVDNSGATIHQSYNVYQFFFYDKEIITQIPTEKEDNVLLFCNKKLEISDYYEYQLDKNEYIYARGKHRKSLEEWLKEKK